LLGIWNLQPKGGKRHGILRPEATVKELLQYKSELAGTVEEKRMQQIYQRLSTIS
jgi:hypothetical protein